ncbi:MAG: biotin/lipoyl-containing protein, partial [Actinomycetota bacterium]
MPVSVTLPALGESVTEGTVTRWLKQEGEPVQADEPLLEVSTDKVDTEIPAPASGVLLAIKVREDETVAVGTELAVIGESAETAAPDSPREQHPAGTGPAGEVAAGAPGAGAPAWPTWGTQPTPPQPSPAHAAPAPAQPSPAHAAPAPAEPKPAHAGGPTVSVTLPALGESVTEGTVTRWLKQEGEPVHADEPLLEVSTDKVDTEIPAPASGVLLAIKVREDETVAVGSELAVIGPDGAGAGARQEEAPAQAATPAPAVGEPAPATPPATPP